jgi:hypothetical protein
VIQIDTLRNGRTDKAATGAVLRDSRCSSAITVPSAILNAADRLVIPWRAYRCRHSGMSGIIGSTGWDRSSASIWLFDCAWGLYLNDPTGWTQPPRRTNVRDH